MSDQGKVARFFYNEEHASAISDIVEDIRDAITDYQVNTLVHNFVGR